MCNAPCRLLPLLCFLPGVLLPVWLCGGRDPSGNPRVREMCPVMQMPCRLLFFMFFLPGVPLPLLCFLPGVPLAVWICGGRDPSRNASLPEDSVFDGKTVAKLPSTPPPSFRYCIQHFEYRNFNFAECVRTVLSPLLRQVLQAVCTVLLPYSSATAKSVLFFAFSHCAHEWLHTVVMHCCMSSAHRRLSS